MMGFLARSDKPRAKTLKYRGRCQSPQASEIGWRSLILLPFCLTLVNSWVLL